MAQPELTKGFFKLLETHRSEEILPQQPVFQILTIREIPNANDSKEDSRRFKLLVTDGEGVGFIATHLNASVDSGEIAKGKVIQLLKTTYNLTNTKLMIIIMDLKAYDAIPFPAHLLNHTIAQKENNKAKELKTNDVHNGNASYTSQQIAQPGSNFQQPNSDMASNPMTDAISSTVNIDRFRQNLNSYPNNTNNGNNNNSFRSGGESGKPVIPIAALNPFQNNWYIKATVTYKSDIKSYNNQKGPGKLFNIHLMDESDEIRATGFNEQLDKFYDSIQLNKSYYISGLKIVSANKKFSTLKNDYELTFTQSSEITPCGDENPIPKLKYNFIPIKDIEKTPVGDVIDVLGVVKEVEDVQIITSQKTNKELKKRTLLIADQSLASIRLTLWDKHAEDFDYREGVILAIHNSRVGDYQGKNISSLNSSLILVNPDLPEAYKLQIWYQSNGSSASFQSFHNPNTSSGPAVKGIRLNLKQINDDPSFGKEKNEMFNCIGVITKINDNITYPACPTDKCGKKMIPLGSEWECAKCNRTFESPDYRYIISCCIADEYNEIWIQLFNNHGQQVLGVTAEEFEQYRSDDNKLAKIKSEACFKPYHFTITAKNEIYNDISRVRYVASSVLPVDPVEHSKELLMDIMKY